MNYNLNRIGLTSILFSLVFVGYGQDALTAKQKEIVETIEGFSKTTAPGGNGADAYGSFLADDFSRWTIGSAITNDKIKWVEGIREWFDDGWRVSDRKQQILEILIMNDFAHTRRIVTETYLGPNGDSTSSTAALVEIWIYIKGNWLLYRVNVRPMDSK